MVSIMNAFRSISKELNFVNKFGLSLLDQSDIHLKNGVKFRKKKFFCTCQENVICRTFSLCNNTQTKLHNGIYVQLRYNHKAAVMGEFGSKLEIKEMKSAKKLKENEVRIAVHNCAVNVTDLLICKGEYESKPKLPFIPGYEIAGEVLEVGSKITELATGNRVIGLNKEHYSGFAEECIIGQKDLWKIPQDMSFETAAALTDSYATVLIAARRANLQTEDTVLVTAAAGGLGLAAVDIAANLFKSKVIGACGTEDKAALVRDKGAFSAINYTKKEMVNAVMKITNGLGVKVVFDAVGGEAFDNCFESLAHEGSVIVAGFASRQVPHILTSKLLPKSCSLIGVSLTHYRLAANDVYRSTVQEVIDMCHDEFIEPHISAQFDLEQVNDALQFIEERKSTGKVILNIK